MLQTRRLILRDLVSSDFDAVHDYASDPEEGL
jgi:RimJ/RimL family protein N-acetyltransferase